MIQPSVRLDFMKTTSTATLMERLRGERTRRPPVDPTLAGGLRAWLEDDLSLLVGDLDPTEPLVLTPRTLSGDDAPPAPLHSRARGALVRCLIAERILLGDVEHPMDDALSALEGSPQERELVDVIHSLDPDAFAMLAAEVTAHDEMLGTCLGPIPGHWLPRLGVRMSIPFVGGRVILASTVDVLLGPPASRVASTCLLDITTAPLHEGAASRLGGLALLETLRTGAAPLRVAALSTATGADLVLDIDDEVLVTALRHITATVERKRTAHR